ncbi:MAG: hypothetical protein ACOYVK_02335 [Bacillota bacterium]
MEDEGYKILSGLELKNVTLINLSSILDENLLRARSNRNHLEFCWTLKANMLYYIMTHYPNAQYFAHLDADLCFFANPDIIFEEAPHASLFLTDHNNSERFLYTYDLTGRYNTGFVGCKNDPIAYAAVDWWRSRCLEWCSTENKVEEKLFGDQRYVERWVELFGQHLHVIRTIGANVAVWNIDQYQVSVVNNVVYINNEKLIFYHFSGFSIYSEREFNLSWFYVIPDHIVRLIYFPYTMLLSKAISQIHINYPYFKKGMIHRGEVPDIHYFKV